MLSLNELVQHADAVLPIENQALHDIVAKVDKQVSRSSGAVTVDLISKGKARVHDSILQNIKLFVTHAKVAPTLFRISLLTSAHLPLACPVYWQMLPSAATAHVVAPHTATNVCHMKHY